MSLFSEIYIGNSWNTREKASWSKFLFVHPKTKFLGNSSSMDAFLRSYRFFWHLYFHIYDCCMLYVIYIKYDIFFIYDCCMLYVIYIKYDIFFIYDRNGTMTYTIWQMYIWNYGCQKYRYDLWNAAIEHKLTRNLFLWRKNRKLL